MGKELGRRIFPSGFTIFYFAILICLALLTAVTACFSFGLFMLGEFITKGWLNALAVIALAGEIWLLISLVASAINALKIRKFENARVEKVSMFCMHLDVISKLVMIMGIIVTVMCLIYSCVWFCSALNILPSFVDWVGSVINGIFGWHLDLKDETVMTPLKKAIEFAKGSRALAVLLSFLLPILAGAATYFGHSTLRKTLRSYESMHVDGNAPPVKAPAIPLLVCGCIFAFIGIFLIAFFLINLRNPSIFTKIFEAAKQSCVDTICKSVENAFNNLTNEKLSVKLEPLKEALLKLIGETLRAPIAFIFKVLITLLSILRYLAFLAFDYSLIIFGGYLALKGVMFATIGNKPITSAPVEEEEEGEPAEEIEEVTVSEDSLAAYESATKEEATEAATVAE